MPFRTSEIDRAWNKLGMEIVETHHRRALFYQGDRLILKTYRSQGKGEMKGRDPDKIRSQMRLDPDQFQQLIDCPLGLSEYIEILRGLGILN